MLLPNEMKPETSIYYYSSFILKELQENETHDVMSLFQVMKKRMNLSLKNYSYCLDWLYLIEAAQVGDNGEVRLCT